MSASKKILITGADGFIGSHLTEVLVRSRVMTFELLLSIIPLTLGAGLTDAIIGR